MPTEETTQVVAPAEVEDTSTGAEPSDSQPTPGQEADDAADDAAISTLLKGNGREAAEKAIREYGKKPQETAIQTPAGAAAAQTPGTTPATTDSQPKPNLSADERELLRRFQLDEEDLPANPERRTKYLANLKTRHDDQARLYREREQFRQELEKLQKTPPATPAAQTNQTQPQATPPTPAPAIPKELQDHIDARVKWVKENYGDEWAEQEKNHLNLLWQQQNQQYEQRLSPLTQQAQELKTALDTARQTVEAQGAMLQQLHIEQGLEQVHKLLPDLPLDDATEQGKANAAKLMTAAIELLNANFNPSTFNLRHALAKAAPSVFSQELQLAERKRLAKAQEQALRGGATRTGDPARTKPRPSEDDLDDLVLAGIGEGKPLKELEQIAQGRG